MLVRSSLALLLVLSVLGGCAEEPSSPESADNQGLPQQNRSVPPQDGSSTSIAPGEPGPHPGPPGPSVNRGFGYTMGVLVDPALPAGTVLASCHGQPQPVDSPHAGSCNPYTGDMSCERALPILCVHPDGSAPPASSYTFGFYNGWVGGKLAATSPVPGTQLTSRESADARCAAELGEGFRMAEHHDGGGGWGLVGWNADVPGGTRLWTYIDDQPGNCWNAVRD